MEELEKQERIIKRAVKNGVTEIEAKWYLQMLVEHCEENCGFYNRVDAIRMAYDMLDDELAGVEAGEGSWFTKFRAKRPRIQEKVLAFINALQRAKDEALKFKDVDDGGTCNFDCPEIRLAGWRERLAKRAARVVGLDCDRWDWHYMNYHISGACDGQGNRRTTMAEAFARSMESAGYETAVWYAMD